MEHIPNNHMLHYRTSCKNFKGLISLRVCTLPMEELTASAVRSPTRPSALDICSGHPAQTELAWCAGPASQCGSYPVPSDPRGCVLSCSVMSNSLRPHGLEPTRHLCLWDFPGKNIGVGCHFILQGIFQTKRSNHHLLLWQVDSLPPHRLGSPSDPQ